MAAEMVGGQSDDVHQAPANITPASMDDYTFPELRLKRTMNDPEKTPSCCSDYELIGGYLSPVSDAYRKAGLASADHRVAMCQLAVDQTSDWLMVDTWEPTQKAYQPTAVVLDHFDHEINVVRNGVEAGDGTRKPVRIALLAGADLIHTMSTPGVWSEKDLDHILGKYGSFIVERSGTDIDEALASLQPWKDNIHVIQQLIQNDVSSTKIRLFLRREMSVRYLIPVPVIHYIEQHHLYEDDGTTEKGKERG
ncbi:nicotinate-nucleotide adenylyltransferase [Penicillium brevicompactum]|uniref:Nicotinamide-nucleotide adenylyltransferase n=2 Tax=Penicillium brevicompactum TaxID=5074 RepID=A0A9W9U901_PENBR|nr:nicotinate-nucleotide adenylyltransferase [Penicillium brevicompactum]